MKRILGTTTLLVIGAFAMSMGGFTKVFDTKYSVTPTSKLGRAGCAVCHVSAKSLKLNPYGLDMQKAMKEANTKKLTPAVLSAIEKLDSNKNGKTNLEDIKADSLP